MRKPCCDKKEKVQGAWSKQEDLKLIDYIQKNGHGRWRSLAKAAGLQRCGKSCRLRWMNYLKPDIKKGNFGDDEDDLIIKLHALLGNRWSLIAGRLPGRTDNEVKNYWNTRLSRKLKKVSDNNMQSKPSYVGYQLNLTPKVSDACCSSMSSWSENQQDKRWFDSSPSSEDHDVDGTITNRRPVELPDLNVEWSIMTCCVGGEMDEFSVDQREHKYEEQ